MNANTVSRKLTAAGFDRSTNSPVKGRGRSRATSGFRVENHYKGGIEVCVRRKTDDIEAAVHAFVIALGFVAVNVDGSVIRYEVAA